LPTPPNDLTNRIISLSRERYAQERDIVEQIVRRNAGLIPETANQSSEQLTPQTAKPKVQAQLNHIEKIENQAASNRDNKSVGSNLLQVISGAQPAAGQANTEQPAKKRRRGKRGGKKNRRPADQSSAQPAALATQNGQSEQVISLH
jgi:hypothetical protein